MCAWKDIFPTNNRFLETKEGILFCGDCLSILRDFPDECVDLIITSPPYNLGNNHHTGNKYHYPYDDDMPEPEYQKWQIEILNECYRVLKQNGSMMYNHKNRIKNGVSITPYEWILKTKFIVKQEIVWINGGPNFDKGRFYPFTERVYWLAKSPETRLINTISKGDVFSRNEWKPQGIHGKHTRAFPLRMVEDLLSVFPDAEIVLDPFMGSGTVAVACRKKKRKWIGIEINEEYCVLIKERLDTKTLPLFSS